MSDIRIKNFINGAWEDPIDHQWLDNVNPTSQVKINLVARSGHQDIDRAVKAGREAFEPWAKMHIKDRADYLRSIADAVQARFEEFALAESQDTGKPLWLSKKLDIPRAIANFRFFADCVEKQASDFKNTSIEGHLITQEPVGIAALITPWNLPLYLLTWKIAPALAYGNTVVCKPSELTSTTAHLLTECLQEAKLPKGVCNMVYGLGHEAGRALVMHADVSLVSFTGGTQTGRTIQKDISDQFKKVSFELGGKNSLIIDQTVDLDQIIGDVIRACFWNQGQICLCAERLLIHESIYNEFKNKFVEETKNLKVGDPLDETHFMGPLISKEHLKKVQGCIEFRMQAGARLLAGDEALEDRPGNFMRPTILEGLDSKHTLHHEEIFGPVVTLEPYENIKNVISYINASPYGLCASIFSSDTSKGQSIAKELKVGTVWINTWLKRDLRVPFGGMKSSGLGREGGQDSIDFFTEKKVICKT